MEAFILADRVLTKEHMSPRPKLELKYIKKYDLPTQTHSHFQIKKKTKNHRIIFNQTPTVDTRKVKNLLSSLIEEPIYSPKPIKSKDGNQ